MPYIAVIRDDIENGVLQVTDLWPYTSQLSIYDPPGQTGYLRRGEFAGAGRSAARPTTPAVDGSGETTYDVYGLAAYILDNVYGATATAPFSVANAITAAENIRDNVLDAGLALSKANIDAELNAIDAGSTIDAGGSTGSVEEVVKVCAGWSYKLPAGTAVAGASVADAGDFEAGSGLEFADGMALSASFSGGQLATFSSASFEYGIPSATAGAAVTVYGADGSLYS